MRQNTRDFMFAAIPPQAWLALVGVLIAAPSAVYACRYFLIGLAPHDITQPPVDQSWRSRRKFLTSLLIVAGLGAAVGLAFTSEAERLAKSSLMIPTLFAGAGSVVLKIAFDSFRTGAAVPLVTGLSRTEFTREAAPGRYWASMVWNCVLGATLLLAAPQSWQDKREQPCFTDAGGVDPSVGIKACDLALANTSDSPSAHALALRHRGEWHESAGDTKAALADYDRSLEIDNTKPDTFYRRGLLNWSLKREVLAHEDLSGALALDPEHADALLARASLRSNDGTFELAIEDLNRADRIRPGDARILVNRGIAYGQLGRLQSAERDIAAAHSLEPDNPKVEQGRALLSYIQGDFATARQRAEAILLKKPGDAAARKLLAAIDRKADP